LRLLRLVVDPDLRIGGEQRAELTDNVRREQIAGQLGAGILGRSEAVENLDVLVADEQLALTSRPSRH